MSLSPVFGLDMVQSCMERGRVFIQAGPQYPPVLQLERLTEGPSKGGTMDKPTSLRPVNPSGAANRENIRPWGRPSEEHTAHLRRPALPSKTSTDLVDMVLQSLQVSYVYTESGYGIKTLGIKLLPTLYRRYSTTKWFRSSHPRELLWALVVWGESNQEETCEGWGNAVGIGDLQDKIRRKLNSDMSDLNELSEKMREA